MQDPNQIIKDEQTALYREMDANTLTVEQLKEGWIKVATELISVLPKNIPLTGQPKLAKLLQFNPKDIVPTDESVLLKEYYSLKRMLNLLKEMRPPIH